MHALKLADTMLFLSTLSLRRATRKGQSASIQASYFYPRSPCGERLHYDNYNLHCVEISIHALLAESDYDTYAKVLRVNISIHALLAESDSGHPETRPSYAISIHALLAESDPEKSESLTTYLDFYPRSPCGERRPKRPKHQQETSISIHALLAESDTSL
mgnify:CR=1 FL=1